MPRKVINARKDIDGLAKGESKVAKDETGGEAVRVGREQTRQRDEDVEDTDALGLAKQDEEEGAKSRVERFVKLNHLLSSPDHFLSC